MRTVKRRIWAGTVCEQLVYNVPDGIRNIDDYDPEKRLRQRFKDAEERAAFLKEISRRVHFRNFMANFSPTSLYSTLTFDDGHEVHTFQEAKRIRDNYKRVLQYAYPDAVFFIYMGRGKSTNRIHFHMVSEGIPEACISSKWKYGKIRRSGSLLQKSMSVAATLRSVRPEHPQATLWWKSKPQSTDITISNMYGCRRRARKNGGWKSPAAGWSAKPCRCVKFRNENENRR